MSCSLQSSGMTLCLVPPWIEPTVITAGSIGFVSRLMIVCRSSDQPGGDHDRVDRRFGASAVAAAALHQDVDAIDIRLASNRRDSRSAQSAMSAAVVERDGEIGPREAGEEAVVEHRLGAAADLLGRLADEHDRARPIVSMAGQVAGDADEVRHVQSWPQACMTPTVPPCASFVRTAEAYGRPVCSATGSASMSVRMSSVRAVAVLKDADDAIAADVRW